MTKSKAEVYSEIEVFALNWKDEKICQGKLLFYKITILFMLQFLFTLNSLL